MRKKYRIATMKSTLMMSQLCLKKNAVYPSGPGALLSAMENNVALISSLVTGASATALEASEMVMG